MPKSEYRDNLDDLKLYRERLERMDYLDTVTGEMMKAGLIPELEKYGYTFNEFRDMLRLPPHVKQEQNNAWDLYWAKKIEKPRYLHPAYWMAFGKEWLTINAKIIEIEEKLSASYIAKKGA